MRKFAKTAPVLIVFTLLSVMVCFFGCTKDDIQNQAQKIVGNSGQGGGTSLQSGEIYTQPLPSKENTHYFGEPVPVEVFTGNEEYTVNKMTVLNSFDGENFTFPKRPVENGWVSKDGALNPEYMFVLVDVNVKKTTEGEAGQQPVLLNNLRLVRSGKDGKAESIDDEMEYLYFKETDNAKRSSLPNEYLGVYLDVGCSVECQVGYFVPKNEESDASKLFFELGPNPDKVQYIYPR